MSDVSAAPLAADLPVADALACPVCEYNLFGLTSRLCPECGAPFDPATLRDQIRATGHPWLFEHGKRPSPVRFVRTFFTALLPVRFWRSVQTTHRISMGRLETYAILIVALSLLGQFLAVVVEKSVLNSWQPFSAPADLSLEEALEANRFTWPLFLLWMPASMLALLIFRGSLGRARIRQAQLFRCIAYSLTPIALFPLFALLFRLAVTALYPHYPLPYHSVLAVNPLTLLGTLLLQACYLSSSAKRYLGVRFLAADVALSQLVAALLIITVTEYTSGLFYDLCFIF